MYKHSRKFSTLKENDSPENEPPKILRTTTLKLVNFSISQTNKKRKPGIFNKKITRIFYRVRLIIPSGMPKHTSVRDSAARKLISYSATD